MIAPRWGYHQPLHGGCGNRVDALHHGSGRGGGLLGRRRQWDERGHGPAGCGSAGHHRRGDGGPHPLLSLVAALPVVPVVLVTRSFQVRVRDAERASRQAVGLQNTHLQEMLGGVEVIRALGSEAAFIARFRAALRDGVAAYNRATVYSALYIPLMVIVSALAMALVLWVGVAGQGLLASLDISLGTLTAFVLLLQRFFVPIMTLGNEWQTVQAALAGLERIFQVLALPPRSARPGARPLSRSTPPSTCGR